MREQLLHQLEALFENLESQLDSSEGNPCGSCQECCTTRGASVHHVQAIEFDLLETRVGPEKVEQFRAFAARRGHQEVCPYYHQGCTVYAHRPYACRVFGHYRRVDTPLPEVCVFRGQERIFGVEDYPREMPLLEELARLNRAYWAYRLPRPELAHSEKPGLAVTTPPPEQEETPYGFYCRSLAEEEAGRPDLACQAITRALEMAPESSDLWHRLGCILFALGERQAAEQALERTVALWAGHARAWAMLGMFALLSGRPAQAVERFERALALGYQDPIVERRLEEARSSLAS